MRRLALPLTAIALVTAVLGVQVAAGGGHYTPRQPTNPCTPRPTPPIPPRLEPLAQQIVLAGLDNTACQLGIPREQLVLDLADTHPPNPRAPTALKTGLQHAIDQLDHEHHLPKISQLLPQALEQANLPTIAKTIIKAIPDSIIDNLLPTTPLLHQTIDELDINQLLHQLHDPHQLNSTIQTAILHATLQQILARLHP